MKKLITGLTLAGILLSGAQAEAAPAKYAHDRQLTYIPNMTDPQHLSYSIRGLSKSDWRYKAIVKGINRWDASPYVEFTREISPYRGYKRGDNHVFIDYVNYTKWPNRLGMAGYHHVTLYSTINRQTSAGVSGAAFHEVGHTLGLADHKVKSYRVMSPTIYDQIYFDSYAKADLRHRYTAAGRYYFDRYKGAYRGNWNEQDMAYYDRHAYENPDVTDW